MPALMLIIGGSSEPLRREMAMVNRMGKEMGVNLQNAMEGGGHVKSGAIRETLVLMREISRGNWNRVPGSFSILMQQLGVLSKLTGNQATASQILAKAWEAQAAKAGIAAIAATRKAQASMAVFEADTLETEATLAQAIADENAAGAAILNAKATQQKAVAAMEAAATAGGTGASVLGIIGTGLAVVAAVALVVYETFWGMRKALEGMKMPEFNLDYVPKQLRTTNQALEAQKKITDEVKKTAEAYNSAEARAKRVADSTKEHYEHLRKMNSFEKNPATKAVRELEIDRQEHNAELANKFVEKQNLEIESKRKSAEAAAIHVTSEADENATGKGVKERADAAREFLKVQQGSSTWGELKKDLAATFGGGGNPTGYKDRVAAIEQAEQMNADQANASIQAEKDFADKEQKNKELRKKKSDAENAASKSAADAAKIGLEIPDMQKQFSQSQKDKAEESAAELANAPHKMIHGHVNSLQQVGAYTSGAVDIQRRSLHHLAKIEKNTDHLGHEAAGAYGKVKF